MCNLRLRMLLEHCVIQQILFVYFFRELNEGICYKCLFFINHKKDVMCLKNMVFKFNYSDYFWKLFRFGLTICEFFHFVVHAF